MSPCLTVILRTAEPALRSFNQVLKISGKDQGLGLMTTHEILKYMKIIRKWWWVIAFLFGATVGTMLIISLMTKTQYEATATLQVSAPPPQEVPLYSQVGRQAVQDEIAQTQTSFNEFLLAGNVAWRVLEVLPDVSMTGEQLRDSIIVDIPNNSQLMRISVRAANPELAAQLANKVVEIGLEQYGALRAQPTANTRKFIEQELEVARDEVKSSEAELAQFQINNKIGQLDVAINKQYDLVRSLNTERDLARADSNLEKAQALQEIIFEREAELQDMIGLSAQYSDLADRVDRARSTFNFLLDKRTEAQIKENQILTLSSVQVITPARPPQKPVAAINGKIAILAAGVSLVTGILLTLLFEYMEISGTFSGIQKRSEKPGAIPLPDSAG